MDANAFMTFETNPIVRILGQESDIQYADKVVAFFFALACVRQAKGNYVAKFFSAAIKMYGALAFVLPLCLNGLPSSLMKEMDDVARMIIVAMIVNDVPFTKYLGNEVGMVMDYMCDFSYAIMRANACAAGYAAFASGFPNSEFAPFVGAMIAVLGHRMIESGMKAFNVSVKGNDDDKLAVFGGGIIYVATNYCGASAMAARAALAGLNCVHAVKPDAYDALIDSGNAALNSVTGAVGLGKKGSAMKRGRSKTPSRK